jgi:hypothetical protein
LPDQISCRRCLHPFRHALSGQDYNKSSLSRTRVVSKGAQQRKSIGPEVFGIIDPEKRRLPFGPVGSIHKRDEFRGKHLGRSVGLAVRRDPVAQRTKDGHGGDQFGSDFHCCLALASSERS